MDADTDLAPFSRWAACADDEIDLAAAALEIARLGHPWLEPAGYLSRLDEMGGEVRLRGGGTDAVLGFLYGQLGFAGNDHDFYDPRNSFLNEVIDRRIGIPISLGVLVLEVARRASIPAHGISFPGHFLVGFPTEDGTSLVDPFTGEILDHDGLRELHHRTSGEAREPRPELLVPADRKAILLRMLGNLRTIYRGRGDAEELREVLRRIHLLSPSDPAVNREIGLLDDAVPSSGAARLSIN